LQLGIMAENQVLDSIRMSKYFLFGLLFLLMVACDPSVEESGVPNVAVNIEINLNDIDNFALKQIGGFIYVQGGVRGIIVRRESQNLYKAYDRNCTYQPSVTSAVVDVHSSGFYMEDTSCTSTFDLNGFPTGGPAEFPLTEYGVSLAGDLLFIFN
jgi:hypothetical protein